MKCYCMNSEQKRVDRDGPLGVKFILHDVNVCRQYVACNISKRGYTFFSRNEFSHVMNL